MLLSVCLSFYGCLGVEFRQSEKMTTGMTGTTMPKGDRGKKITATVGLTDYKVIAALCKARGITISQLIQEWIADNIKYTVSTGLIAKFERIKEDSIDEELPEED